jgi:hypothetical protein
MYAFPEMLELTKQVWPSDIHKIVATNCLIGNRRYFTMTDLMEACRIIADIPEDRIKLVTANDLSVLGVMID